MNAERHDGPRAGDGAAEPTSPLRLLIVCVEAVHEAHAVRAAAEAWGWDVSVVWAGSKRDVIRAVARSVAFDVLVLACHGDERGLLMPAVAPELVETLGGGAEDIDAAARAACTVGEGVLTRVSDDGSVNLFGALSGSVLREDDIVSPIGEDRDASS